jgi:hypothetical protein
MSPADLSHPPDRAAARRIWLRAQRLGTSSPFVENARPNMRSFQHLRHRLQQGCGSLVAQLCGCDVVLRRRSQKSRIGVGIGRREFFGPWAASAYRCSHVGKKLVPENGIANPVCRNRRAKSPSGSRMQTGGTSKLSSPFCRRASPSRAAGANTDGFDVRLLSRIGGMNMS